MGVRERSRLYRGALVALVVAFVAIACDVVDPNGPYAMSVAPGLHPRLSPYDAVRITRDYLHGQSPQIAAPELHVPPNVTSVWAVNANQARSIDGCIPSEQADRIVWVTKGEGDYLNLSDHPWSKFERSDDLDPLALTCEGPGTAGTIVIDDSTGQILGVYPAVASLPHPTSEAN